MQTQHTPGPWRAEYTNAAKQTYVAVSVHEGANGSTAVIGQCAGPDKEANAHLIAAAPEMLAALKVALTWSDEDWVGHEIVTAAIAKAVGHNT